MKLNLAHQLILIVGAALLLTVTTLTVFTVNRASEQITESARRELAHVALMARNQCEIAGDLAESKIRSDIAAAEFEFGKLSEGRVELQNDLALVVGEVGAENVLNGYNKFPNDVYRQTGAACVLFVADGERAAVVSSSIDGTKYLEDISNYVNSAVYDDVVHNGRRHFGLLSSGNGLYYTAHTPIKDTNNSVVGILTVSTEAMTELLHSSLLSQSVGKTGHLYAFDPTGVLRIHPEKEGCNIGSYNFVRKITAEAPMLSEGEAGWIVYPWINEELRDAESRDKIAAYVYFNDWNWIIAADSYLEDFSAPVKRMRNASLFVGLAILIASLSTVFFYARKLTRPMGRLVEIADAVAEGDVNQQVNIKSKAEIGKLARSIGSMMEYLREAASYAERIAHNDLTLNVKPKSSKDVLGISFRSMTLNLSSIIHQLSVNSEELVSAASEIAATSEQMSHGASDQSDRIVEASSAIEEMSVTLGESSQNATTASEAASNASESASAGGRIVSDTVRGMESIADVVKRSADSIEKLASSAEEIGEITRVIDDIADQTNLLALNAAIEAARAGEQGRGFAVVADEVRKLAERTGKATGEITDMITGIQSDTSSAVASMRTGVEKVEEGKSLADKAGDSLREIVDEVGKVSEMISQIAVAAQEQSAASDSIASNVDNIKVITRQTSEGAKHAAAAGEELSRQADSLKILISKFKIADRNKSTANT